MPGFGDSAFIILLALLLFGPKKLPVLARQLGKLMGDFRRASNEFRTQMEEELRISEQADRQKQIEAIQASAPPAPVLATSASQTTPFVPPPPAGAFSDRPEDSIPYSIEPPPGSSPAAEPAAPAPTSVPIATAGSLTMRPPATGLPVAAQSSTTTPSENAEADLPAETLHHG